MKTVEFFYNMQIEFSQPVMKHCYSLRCIPFNDEVQTIKNISVEVSPQNNPVYTSDSFGNTVLTDRILLEHSLFKVNVSGEADIDLSRLKKEDLNPLYKYPSSLTKPGDRIYKIIKEANAYNISCISSKAEALCKTIHKHLFYKSNSTNINTTAEQALEIGFGVCQDFSHVLISALRTIGIPARYVAGIQQGTGETHAWVEIYDDGLWKGIDITNDKLIDETYIKLSHGRDFADCGINRGLFIGGGSQNQTINASLKVKK